MGEQGTLWVPSYYSSSPSSIQMLMYFLALFNWAADAPRLLSSSSAKMASSRSPQSAWSQVVSIQVCSHETAPMLFIIVIAQIPVRLQIGCKFVDFIRFLGSPLAHRSAGEGEVGHTRTENL